MPEGAEAEGWAGLRDYIVTTRMEEFRRNFLRNICGICSRPDLDSIR